MKRFLFIINPISGVRSKESLPEQIKQHFSNAEFSHEIRYTERHGHAAQIAKEAVSENFDAVVAVGGDGSVNEVARGLLNSNVAMGIIPRGSGNGLARHLGIPLKPKKAFEILKSFNTQAIDACKLNHKHFFSLMGVGFDAYVVEKYDQAKGRGFFTYAKSILKVLFKYPDFNFSMDTDGVKQEGKAFQINISNSNQFGYDMKVAPQAKLQDGKVVVSITKPFPRWKSAIMAIQLKRGTIHRSKYVEQITCSSLNITTEEDLHVQLDGEMEMLARDLNVQVLPGALQVITP